MFFSIFKAHRGRFLFTLFLILSEAAMGLLFPLFIGLAIDSALDGQYSGALQLGGLGILALIFGAGRRFYDTRFYARIFQERGQKLLIQQADADSSVKTARLNMMREVIAFFEHSFPALIESAIGFVGVIVIIATLNWQVFLGTLIASMLILIIYLLTGKRTISLNKGYNDELEKQVAVIESKDAETTSVHLNKMMRWSIRLSDLETVNFSVSWILLMAFLVVSVVIGASEQEIQTGALFALVMYVFQFMESVMNLPYFYQQWLRLTEIRDRLEEI